MGDGFCRWLNAEMEWQHLSMAVSCKYPTRGEKKDVTERLSLNLGSDGWWKEDIALDWSLKWKEAAHLGPGCHG